MTTLAERLGHPAEHAPGHHLLRRPGQLLTPPTSACTGRSATASATCASLMVPAPWARARRRRATAGDDIGVHLTLNAEHDALPLGPDHPRPVAAVAATAASRAPSTTSGSTPTPTRCCRECRAQIERAIAWGIDVTHLAPHLTAITLRPEFFDVYLELAVEFALPIRLPSTITDRAGRVPVPPAGRRGGRRLPRPLRPRLAGRQPRARLRGDRATCSRASPRSTCSRRSTRPRCGR